MIIKFLFLVRFDGGRRFRTNCRKEIGTEWINYTLLWWCRKCFSLAMNWCDKNRLRALLQLLLQNTGISWKFHSLLMKLGPKLSTEFILWLYTGSFSSFNPASDWSSKLTRHIARTILGTGFYWNPFYILHPSDMKSIIFNIKNGQNLILFWNSLKKQQNSGTKRNS